MTYGNTTSEQTTYNARLQPATYTLNNMNYQNTNVCCSYPTYSTMTWSYRPCATDSSAPPSYSSINCDQADQIKQKRFSQRCSNRPLFKERVSALEAQVRSLQEENELLYGN
jgi:hypothetical protein